MNQVANRFASNIVEIDSKIELIKNYCVDGLMKQNLNDVDWNSVGSSYHVLELLDEIIVFLNIKKD